MENGSRYFKNVSCEFFPCHADFDGENFNCLFCFCPLYHLGADCGGIFEFTERNVKSCLNCEFPHIPENYDEVMERLA
jgi:Zn-finger protein